MDTSLTQAADAKDPSWYLPLHKAALQGDWDSANRFFQADPQAKSAKISKAGQTALHIAINTGHDFQFIEKLVGLLSREEVAQTDTFGNTALDYAAMVGNTAIAKMLVEKNSNLTKIANNFGNTASYHAAKYAHGEILSYLISVTEDDGGQIPFRGGCGWKLLYHVILAGFYDSALYLVQRFPNMATELHENQDSPLNVLANKIDAFPSGSRFKLWQRFIYSCITVKLDDEPHRLVPSDVENNAENAFPVWDFVSQKFATMLWNAMDLIVPGVKHIHDTKLRHMRSLQLLKSLCMQVSSLDDSKMFNLFSLPILTAARLGIPEVVTEIIQYYPPSLWYLDEENRTIFQLAVRHRQDKVFNCLYQMNTYRNTTSAYMDKYNNNILHLAGKLAPSPQLNSVTGAAFQMQRELQWFKKVEKFVQPAFRELKNSEGKTPRLTFTDEHKDLVKEGEKWMKETATSCTVVAALIATVVFAAAITVPGGNNGDTGIPIFSRDKSFTVFAVSDALSLFSSSTSVLMFLSILTSRYAEEDFLFALPKRFIIGLISLFVSIVSMMVAFSATVFIVFGHQRAWLIIPISSLACLPVALFVFLQIPLLVDMVYFTYGSGIFYQEKKDKIL